jgi:hypothetical protein
LHGEKLPDGSEVDTSSQGCLTGADKQIFGSIERKIRAESFTTSLS